MIGLRKVCYVTGTRADFGLMRSTLRQINHAPNLELAILATGSHLSDKYGMTIREIETSGLPLAGSVAIEDAEPTGALMARNIGRMTTGFADALENVAPNVVLLLGDRGEMLAAAVAALHLNLPIAHIHGGERSGTVDEPIRHAISKLAHFHFVSSEESKERLLRMGEARASIWVVGAPGLDGLGEIASKSRHELCAAVGFNPERHIALFVFHPVLQEAPAAGNQARLILDVLLRKGLQVIALAPNSDAGSGEIRRVLEQLANQGELLLFTHLDRRDFISWMAAADVMVGNSSSGIIEAATFGTPVLNVGTRQNLRQRNLNVVDVEIDPHQIGRAIEAALNGGRRSPENVFGDGNAGERIARLLTEIDLSPIGAAKVNAY